MKKEYLKNIKMLALIGCSVVSTSGIGMAKSKLPSEISTNGIVEIMLKEVKTDPDCYQLITNLLDRGNEQNENAVAYSKNFDKNTHDRAGYSKGGFDRSYSRDNFSKTNFDKATMVGLNIPKSGETDDQRVLEIVNNRIEVFKNKSVNS